MRYVIRCKNAEVKEMKYSVLTMLMIITLFLTAQIFGLAINNFYFTSQLPYGIKPPEVKEEVSPWFFVSTLIIVTIVFLMLRKLKFELLLKLWFFAAFVAAVSITLSVFMEEWIAVIVATSLIILRMKEKDLFLHNITEILVYGGIVSIFAPILNILAVIILFILISIYDFIAVNITKHMIGLAKMQEELGIFSGLIVINRSEAAILGGGDVAFTLLFATVALRDFGAIPAILVVYGATLGIIALMLMGKKKKFYPAMPFISTGSLLGFAISFLL